MCIKCDRDCICFRELNTEVLFMSYEQRLNTIINNGMRNISEKEIIYIRNVCNDINKWLSNGNIEDVSEVARKATLIIFKNQKFLC
jgi:hypothetical protein